MKVRKYIVQVLTLTFIVYKSSLEHKLVMSQSNHLRLSEYHLSTMQVI